MQIEKLIRALLPDFKKDRVTEDIRFTRGELKQLEDAYGDAAKLLGHWNFKSEDLKLKFASFKRIVSTGSDNPIVFLSKNIPLMLKNLDVAEELASNALNNTIASSGLTYKQATIIQYASALNFVCRYGRKFLNYIYVAEAMNYREEGEQYLKDSIPDAEVKWINDKFVDFCAAVAAVTDKPETTLKKFEEIPDIEVARSNPKTLSNTVGDAKLDPFRMNFIGTRLNPILFFRMVVSEWQFKRHKENKEELALLQLRRLNLEKLKQGQHDARVEKEIQDIESRVNKLSMDIAEMEGSVSESANA